MKPLSPDTTPEVQLKQYELMSKLSPTQKLEMALDLTDATRKLIIADLKHRFPQAKEETIRRKFIARVLPREDVIRVYGFDPSTEDL
jgi:hypothetical protein